MTLVAILAAAGRGERLGGPKQLLELGGKPLAAWALEALERSRSVDGIYIACEEEQRERFQALGAAFAPLKSRAVVAGGATRQASVCAALSAIAPAPDFVLVHDGARPFVTPELIERVAAAAAGTGAAIAAVPVKDTIKQATAADTIERTIAREGLWSAQTPQVFAYELLLAAHAKGGDAGLTATDDAALVERLGAPVVLVMGTYGNMKITTPDDLEYARFVAAQSERVGR
jgi:2-C-methyl-D-erythritol 4-phosphate cytidylyltransferase